MRVEKYQAESMMPVKTEDITISMDGKTIRSTGRMNRYENPLHIVSAQVCELGITFAQRSVRGKSNEIPAVQELLKERNLSGYIVVADALNCQKKTARAIVDGKADYLLCAKDNQETLKKDIEDYVQDNTLRASMESVSKVEKNRDRIEKRTAYVTDDIGWMPGKEGWKNLKGIGGVHTEFETKGVKTSEWHSYIYSRNLTAKELLYHVRIKRRVETMHCCWMCTLKKITAGLRTRISSKF